MNTPFQGLDTRTALTPGTSAVQYVQPRMPYKYSRELKALFKSTLP